MLRAPSCLGVNMNARLTFQRSAPRCCTIHMIIAALCLFGLAPGAWAQGMVGPVRIAEGAPGQLLVTDYAAEAVFVVDRQTLEPVWRIDLKANAPGVGSMPATPMGVARHGNLLFIGNEAMQTVEVYEVDDAKQKVKLAYTLGAARHGDSPGFFQRPTDIAIDAQQQLVFVLDLGDQMVKVFDVAGNFVESFAPQVPGTATTFVSSIAVDPVRKEILISDHGNPYGAFSPAVPARLLVFNYAGAFQRLINGNGVVSGTGTVPQLQFTRPHGLVSDGVGHIFMVDHVIGEVIVFDQNVVLDSDNVAVVKRLPGVLSGTDVWVDATTGDIFVVNNNAARVQVFRGEGRLP